MMFQIKKVVIRMRRYWEKLLRANLISERKFAYLTKLELTPEDKARFIQRQLVETRQITKHVAAILDQYFNQSEESKDKRYSDHHPKIILSQSVSKNFWHP